MKQAASRLLAGFLLGIFFSPEDGGDIFLRNVDYLLLNYTALYPRKYNSSSIEECRVDLVRNDVSEEHIASIFRVEISASKEPV
jgi:hypothetical protein